MNPVASYWKRHSPYYPLNSIISLRERGAILCVAAMINLLMTRDEVKLKVSANSSMLNHSREA